MRRRRSWNFGRSRCSAACYATVHRPAIVHASLCACELLPPRRAYCLRCATVHLTASVRLAPVLSCSVRIKMRLLAFHRCSLLLHRGALLHALCCGVTYRLDCTFASFLCCCAQMQPMNSSKKKWSRGALDCCATIWMCPTWSALWTPHVVGSMWPAPWTVPNVVLSLDPFLHMPHRSLVAHRTLVASMTHHTRSSDLCHEHAPACSLITSVLAGDCLPHPPYCAADPSRKHLDMNAHDGGGGCRGQALPGWIWCPTSRPSFRFLSVASSCVSSSFPSRPSCSLLSVVAFSVRFLLSVPSFLQLPQAFLFTLALSHQSAPLLSLRLYHASVACPLPPFVAANVRDGVSTPHGVHGGC